MTPRPLLAAFVVRLFGRTGRVDRIELHDLRRGDSCAHATLRDAFDALQQRVGEDGAKASSRPDVDDIESQPEGPAAVPGDNPWR